MRAPHLNCLLEQVRCLSLASLLYGDATLTLL